MRRQIKEEQENRHPVLWQELDKGKGRGLERREINT
jgi:hypothetical protein